MVKLYRESRVHCLRLSVRVQVLNIRSDVRKDVSTVRDVVTNSVVRTGWAPGVRRTPGLAETYTGLCLCI